MVTGEFVLLCLALWTSNGVTANLIPWAQPKIVTPSLSAKEWEAKPKPDGFDTTQTLYSVTQSFRELLLELSKDGAYESQCITDFRTLFNTKDNNTVFHASKGTQAVDALGKPGADILNGNFHLVGSFDECLDIGEGYTQFCSFPLIVTLTYNPNVTLPPLTMDICVPQSCNISDLLYFISLANSSLHSIPLPQAQYFSLRLGDPDKIVCDNTKSVPYTTGAIIMITVCAIFLALAFVGSAVDFGVRNLKQLLTKPELSFLLKQNSYAPENAPLLGTPQSRRIRDVFSPIAKPLEFITAFSIFKNVSQILATRQPPTAITSLNGIRVISMFWVILGHTHLWAFIYGDITNSIYAFYHIPQRFSFQAIGNAYFSVDSFFFLSGTLVAYLTLREMERKKGRFPLLTYYLHRYLRLTMVYAFVLFFWWTLTVYLGNGPGWKARTGVGSLGYEQCNKYWWTNLLYINNFHPWNLDQECMGWTWYLANDMQFYILAPIILIPLYYIFPIGLAISGVFIAITFAANGAIAGAYGFDANTYLSGGEAGGQQSGDIYVKPYCRAAPYIVGLVLGFVLFKRVKINFHWIVDWLIYCAMWVVAAGCCFSVVYGLYSSWHGHDLTLGENVVYYMLSRFVWGVGLALMVFSCHNGYGWVVNDFLSMKMWIPLSRLTYTAYLVHPMILTIIFGTNRIPLQYTDYTMAVYAVAVIVLSFGAAGVIAVFVEFPLSNLEMAIFNALGLKRRESTRHINISENEASHNTTPLPSTPINNEEK